MDAMLTVILFVSGTILTIIGFFIKGSYNTIITDLNSLNKEFQEHREDHGKLKGKLELLEQEHRLKYQLIQEVTQQEIKNMASQIGKLSDTVGELVTFQIKQKQ
jgi:predicted PurR-regulated permease PerM